MPPIFPQAIITPFPSHSGHLSFPSVCTGTSGINLLFLAEHLYPQTGLGFSLLLLFQAWRGPVCQTAAPFFHMQQMLSPHCKTCLDIERDHHTYSRNTGTSPLTYKLVLFSLPCCLASSHQAVLRDHFSPSEKLAETRWQEAVFSLPRRTCVSICPTLAPLCPEVGGGKVDVFPIKIAEQFVTMHSIPCIPKASVDSFKHPLVTTRSFHEHRNFPPDSRYFLPAINQPIIISE